MTKPKLLLHPGSSQGGSTWIQNLCGRNPEILAQQHFHYLHDFRKLPFDALGSDDPAPFHAALDSFLDRDAPEGSTLWIHEDEHGDVEAVIIEPPRAGSAVERKVAAGEGR